MRGLALARRTIPQRLRPSLRRFPGSNRSTHCCSPWVSLCGHSRSQSSPLRTNASTAYFARRSANEVAKCGIKKRPPKLWQELRRLRSQVFLAIQKGRPRGESFSEFGRPLEAANASCSLRPWKRKSRSYSFGTRTFCPKLCCDCGHLVKITYNFNGIALRSPT